MEFISSLIGGAAWVVVVIIVIALLVVVALYTRSRWKVAMADQALVITGNKKGLRIIPGGGGFVSPLQKHQFFPLGVMTVTSPDQQTQSKTLIPVVVKWTAQLRPDTENMAALESAVVGFIDRDTREIEDSLRQTLDGEVRAVVAQLTPQQVVTDKEDFSKRVADNVSARMTELGFKLISLNISEVNDKNGYFDNLSAADREDRRRTAQTITAEANKQIAVSQADADRVSTAAQLDKDEAIAEKTRDVEIKKAGFRAETDKAQKEASYAGQLAEQDREAELAARAGEVEVVKEQQRQAASVARREVEVTDAETAKRRVEIEAEAQARKTEVEAEAAANVATSRARGEADAAIQRARGEAESAKATTEANAEKVRQSGLAEAEVTRAKGEAEAESIRAKGDAEAEVQQKMAEALAANEGANLQIKLAEIERDTRITISDGVSKTMASVGEKATFIDMGGSSSGEGNLLSRVLGDIPELLKHLDVKSEALHGTSFGKLVGSTVGSVKQPATSEGGEPVAPSGMLDISNLPPELQETARKLVERQSVETNSSAEGDGTGE